MNEPKLDLYKLNKIEYSNKKQPHTVEVKPAQFLTVSGKGEPGGEVYTRKVEALFPVAYKTKFLSKAEGRDYVVCKMEGLWWTENQATWNFIDQPKSEWCWKLLIRTPDFIGQENLKTTVEELRKKGKEGDFEDIKLEIFDEGLSVQALHIGPYADETPLIMAMHDLAQEQGYEFSGLHHEIYLSDPRKVDPSKLKTILRHPIKKV
jgi:hypothetical protein